MKSYAPILRSTGQDFREFDAYVFDKLDGTGTAKVHLAFSFSSRW